MSEHVFDREKWQSLTIFEQMGNIGSEVGRAFAARRRGDTAAMTGAWQRGLDLLDATAEQLARQKSPKLREVLRARELFAGMEDESLENYFMWFAVAARRGNRHREDSGHFTDSAKLLAQSNHLIQLARFSYLGQTHRFYLCR